MRRLGSMAITEVADTPSITATHSPPSHFSLPRHFYCAVDRPQFKMETLVDLLGIASRRRGLPMVVCCSSRDELDAVCSAIPGIPSISLDSVHSDLGESERLSIFEGFRAATVKWNQSVSDDQIGGDEENKSHTIVVTDSCLPFVASGELPVSARVLINYELPTKKGMHIIQILTTADQNTTPSLTEHQTKWLWIASDVMISEQRNDLLAYVAEQKETYLRRMSTCLAADGIVINMVVGGEVVTLKSVEESMNLVIAEMPINISEIL